MTMILENVGKNQVTDTDKTIIVKFIVIEAYLLSKCFNEYPTLNHIIGKFIPKGTNSK